MAASHRLVNDAVMGLFESFFVSCRLLMPWAHTSQLPIGRVCRYG